MSSELAGKVVIVTGAGGGIGREAAIRFASEGARLVLADMQPEASLDVVAQISEKGGAARFIQTNVSDESSVAALVSGTIEHYGRLDGAFNNAGIEQSHKPLHEISANEWGRVLDVNLTGVFFCMKHQIQRMLDSGGGVIVNTSSGLGQVAIPNAAEYIAAKHGVIGLTRAAAIDYGKRGIRVNALLPGIIETPMVERLAADPGYVEIFDELRRQHPMGRLGRPKEVVEAALWLLSDASSFVHGAAISVDGGALAV